jgi:hypothetical protein
MFDNSFVAHKRNSPTDSDGATETRSKLFATCQMKIDFVVALWVQRAMICFRFLYFLFKAIKLVICTLFHDLLSF